MSVVDLSAKVSNETKFIVPSFDLEEQSDERECEANCAAFGESPTIAQTEQALQMFAHRVEQIPGVIQTRRFRAGRLNKEGVMVVVADLFSSVTHDVIQAQERVYDAMPGIRFSLDIKDVSTVETVNNI